jgi:ATP adenylyltransferase
MNKIWAPWRINYLRIKGKKKCIFCNAVKSEAKNYVVLKTKYSIAMLNIFPYNNGHMMISPVRHVKEISQLREAEVLDLFNTLIKTKALLGKVLRPE